MLLIATSIKLRQFVSELLRFIAIIFSRTVFPNMPPYRTLIKLWRLISQKLLRCERCCNSRHVTSFGVTETSFGVTETSFGVTVTEYFFTIFFFTFNKKNKFYKGFWGRWFRISRFYVHPTQSFFLNPLETRIFRKFRRFQVIKTNIISRSLMPNFTVITFIRLIVPSST